MSKNELLTSSRFRWTSPRGIEIFGSIICLNIIFLVINKTGAYMRGSILLFAAAAIFGASWAAPAQAYRIVLLNGDGSAEVCDTSWVTVCWHCYDSSITGNPGWECFKPWNALALKPTGAGQQNQRERLDEWVIGYAQKGSNKHLSEVQAEYREGLASGRRSAADSAKVVAELEKLIPDTEIGPNTK